MNRLLGVILGMSVLLVTYAVGHAVVDPEPEPMIVAVERPQLPSEDRIREITQPPSSTTAAS